MHLGQSLEVNVAEVALIEARKGSVVRLDRTVNFTLKFLYYICQKTTRKN